jgi:hypothetical protein
VLLGQEQGPRMGSFFALYGLNESVKLIRDALARKQKEAKKMKRIRRVALSTGVGTLGLLGALWAFVYGPVWYVVNIPTHPAIDETRGRDDQRAKRLKD